MHDQYEKEFATHGNVAVLRDLDGKRTVCGKDYYPKTGHEVWVPSRNGFQWPVRLLKNTRGVPYFKFMTRSVSMLFDQKRQAWVIQELLG